MKIDKKSIISITLQIIFIITFIIFMFIYLFRGYLNDTIVVENKNIFIPKGSNRTIITYLRDKYSLRLNILDAYILAYFGGAKSGYILLSKQQLIREDFLKELANPKLHMNSITLIPGETIDIFFESLADKYKLSFDKLMSEYKKLAPYKDGIIFPDTYLVSSAMKEEGIVGYLVKFSLEKHKNLAIKYLTNYDKKEWFKYIIIASIIQKESANLEEMPLISSVIFNRLRVGQKLQMDGTLNYGKYSHMKITPDRIRDDDSDYNTYKINGIPSNPVSSVQIEAINAALYPAETKYLYFIKGKNETHIFSENYKEHLKNIKSEKK